MSVAILLFGHSALASRSIVSILCVVFFGGAGCVAACLASETASVDAREVLKALVRDRGDRVIVQCEIAYSVTLTKPAPSERMVQQEVESAGSVIQVRISQATSDGERMRYREALDGLEADVRRQMAANAKWTNEVLFAMEESALGGDRFLGMTMQSNGREPASVETVYRDLGGGGHLAIKSEVKQRTAMITDQPAYFGTEEPHRLGRVVGRLDALGSADDDFSSGPWSSIASIVANESPDFQGHAALELDLTFSREEYGVIGRTTVIVVPTMGNVTPVVRDFAADGVLLNEWRCGAYFPVSQDEGGAIWFPLDVATKQYTPDGSELRSLQYRFREGATTLNRRVPRGRFRIRMDQGVIVLDARVSPAANYGIADATDIGLDDIDSLAANPNVSRVTAIPQADVSHEQPTRRWSIGVLLNLAVLATILGALWYRRRHVAVMALLSVIVGPGCGPVSSHATDALPADADFRLRIDPDSVDFGTVSSSGSTIQQTIRIESRETHAWGVTIESSCGCLVVAPKSVIVSPGETAIVTASLAPDGGTGLRQSQITLTASECAEEVDDSLDRRRIVKAIVAKAMITNEWHATPRRIVVASVGERSSGTVTITAPQSDWGRAAIGVIGRDVTWEESSRPSAHDDGNESRTFRVKVSSDQGGDRGLSFTIAGHDSPVLTVPIVVSR